MLPEEAKKRLSFIIFGIFGVLAMLATIWAFFLNRGTLTIVAEAPFILNIGSIKTLECKNSPCSTVVAPGNYSIKIKKAGYRDVLKDVSVPMWSEHKEEITFSFIAFIKEIGQEKDLHIFTLPALSDEDLAKLPSQNVFFDNAQNAVVYLARSPETHRQTLYFHTLENSVLGSATIATSFIRDLNSYDIYPNLSQQKIAIIDNTQAGSTVYMVDLKTKNRTNLFSYPFIESLKWLPESDNFIFEARPSQSPENAIFLYDPKQEESIKLELKTPLANVVPLNEQNLLAATSQNVSGIGEGQELEGKLVVLGEPTATALQFIDFSLVSLQSRLIKTEENMTFPDALKANNDQKSVYILVGKTVYQLFLHAE